MEGAALLERLNLARTPVVWHTTRVLSTVEETSHARTIVLDVPAWPGHLAGQHVDVRLTAEDGYQAERSYSIASAPEEPGIALTVERIDDGEVSPYLAGELQLGDEFEVRGPIGGPFTWRVEDGGPLLLIGGGSGLVPLMSMVRHRAAVGSMIDTRLLISARTWEDILYRDELSRRAQEPGLRVDYTLTRSQPADWAGFARRVDADMLASIGPGTRAHPAIFVCGPTAFVESAADLLVALGRPPGDIRTERFGPT